MTLLLAGVFGLIGQMAGAADATCGSCDSTPCCDQCGCHCACLQKTCQVVCEMKTETKTCWCVECTEICPLMPGCRDCCDECPPPRCGHPKSVQKLVKKEYQVEKPVYKCVVCNLCPDCANSASGGTAPTAAPNPPPTSAAPPPPPAPAKAN